LAQRYGRWHTAEARTPGLRSRSDTWEERRAVASELDDLRVQLAGVSCRLAAVEEQLSAEAALRAAMDIDQSDLTIDVDCGFQRVRATAR
jgi:hypothetical protein